MRVARSWLRLHDRMSTEGGHPSRLSTRAGLLRLAPELVPGRSVEACWLEQGAALRPAVNPLPRQTNPLTGRSPALYAPGGQSKGAMGLSAW